jgi:hypothetical protein
VDALLLAPDTNDDTNDQAGINRDFQMLDDLALSAGQAD